MLNLNAMKNSLLMALTLGVLMTATLAPTTLAGDKHKGKKVVVVNNYYDDDDDYYDRDNRNRRCRNCDYDDDDYYRRDSRNSNKKVLRDVGIGAAIGAVGGGLIGGKKGLVIGAAVGAAGGYVVNKSKNDRRRW